MQVDPRTAEFAARMAFVYAALIHWREQCASSCAQCYISENVPPAGKLAIRPMKRTCVHRSVQAADQPQYDLSRGSSGSDVQERSVEWESLVTTGSYLKKAAAYATDIYIW